MIDWRKNRWFVRGVKEYIKNSELTQKEVAAAIDLTPGNFSSYLNLRTRMPLYVIKMLTEHLGKPYDHFVDIGKEVESESKDNSYFPEKGIKTEDFVRSLENFVKTFSDKSSKSKASEIDTQLPEPPPIMIQTQYAEKNQKIDEDFFIAVPVYESQKPAVIDGDQEELEQTEKAASFIIVFRPELKHRVKHRLIAFRVKDDSMAPLIPQDSIIVVDTDDRKFVDNKIFGIALDVKDEKPEIPITAKRVRRLKETSGFLLLSENQDHSPKQMEEAAWGRQCIGRVVWMWRSFDD